MDLTSVQGPQGVLRSDFFTRLCHSSPTKLRSLEQRWQRLSIWDTFGHKPGKSRTRTADDAVRAFIIVSHTQLIAHAYAAKLYRTEFQSEQKGTIGITLSGNWSEAWDEDDPRDQEAAERAREFEIAWFADPLYTTGDYPASMRAQLGDRLPHFTPEESKLVLGSSEFYGMNSYTTFFMQHKDTPADINDHKGNVFIHDTNSKGVPRGEESDTPWLRMAPAGFRKLLNWIWSRYHIPIYVTENGTTAKGETAPTSERFFEGYVGGLARAVKEDGVDVRSYFAWTFTDNLGYDSHPYLRNGPLVTLIDLDALLSTMDSPEKTRYPKQSAYYLEGTV
ncbi:hypothetical protein P175DRAFT_0505460 [Aspergillus ochraceoroseus IBT 24754]|uniref:Glycoside hydrolase family 1 protein n=1 Tax=Aspergillus ochraceoroseus IBT 24754 TaxID=1392256 RepID=A0A2T5LKK2_9EURO|nr:uncharacterized protein P175DRAFT_0505460 [Aspergillus ochraceoroseus IBT 24754]PTU16807.1 hypothetical protein P175DRAFT_0505460 [Aspergillus ochraceoroseus IBT 24754]